MLDAIERLRTGLAGRYRIERELGRGGMGIVYAGADLRHGRQVAVKVLEPELASADDAERFLREIEIVARLTHPHILPLHDSGEVDGLLYFVMPLIEGSSLRASLARERRLPVTEALRIADQVAGALDYAHRHGVVHRDVKPGNILLHEGAALLTDFGIALAGTLTGAGQLTRTGFVVGTAEYMSPEQATGEGPVDARGDIYALACVLYEMIAGAPPFTGPNVGAILSQKLTETPRPLERARSDVPHAISDVVAKALARTPADRFASAAAFAMALRAPTPAAIPTANSIVVLPFANLSPDRDNEFFADGLTDELIGDLSKLGALRVICRTSAMAFKGTTKDVRSIAAELEAQYVVEGSVRRAGTRLRVTAQLADAATNACLWSDRYDGVLDDVFAIQERLARRIVEALKLRLTPEEDARLSARPIRDVHAQECYLRARQQMWRWRKDAIEHAMQILSNGLKLVGDNALLHVTLGLAHIHLHEAWIDLSETPLVQAEACARTATALDPALPEGILLRGWIHLARFRISDAVRDFQLVLDAAPNNPDALGILSYCYLISGRADRVGRLIERYLAVDPLNPIGRALRGWADLNEGRYTAAVGSYREMLEMDPSNPMARLFYGWSLICAERGDEADAVLGGFGADMQGSMAARFGACLRAARVGKVDDALPDLVCEFERAGAVSDMFARFLAQCYGLLGDAEHTVYWLRIAADRGFINYPFLAEHDVLVAKVRDAPAFQVLLAMVRERWERFDA